MFPWGLDALQLPWMLCPDDPNATTHLPVWDLLLEPRTAPSCSEGCLILAQSLLHAHPYYPPRKCVPPVRLDIPLPPGPESVPPSMPTPLAF